jgi:transposase InsO family protein
MSFELIEAEKAHYPKALMCRALGLSRSGHHAYSTRGPSRRALEEQQLDVLVAAVFAELGGRYGAPRIEQELRRRGHRTSRKRVAASMLRQGLAAWGRRRWRRTTDSSHREPIFLVVVLDLFSRKVVGWSVGNRLDAELSAEALRRALARRRPGPGLLFHSDRGIEFAANTFRAQLAHAGAVQSMSRRGNCWDNAVAESFFSTLEFEMDPGAAWRWAADAERELFTFIEGYYNARRLHSRNRYRSPNETESDWRSRVLAAQPRCPRNRGKLRTATIAGKPGNRQAAFSRFHMPGNSETMAGAADV